MTLDHNKFKRKRKPLKFSLLYFNVFMKYLETKGHKGPRKYILEHATITDHANRGRGLVVILEDLHVSENIVKSGRA